MTEEELAKQVTDYVTTNGHDPKWISSLLSQAKVLNYHALDRIYCNMTYNKQGGIVMTVGVNPITNVEESKEPQEEER